MVNVQTNGNGAKNYERTTKTGITICRTVGGKRAATNKSLSSQVANMFQRPGGDIGTTGLAMHAL